MMEVRPFARADAAALAGLINRNHYGGAGNSRGKVLSGPKLLDVFEERCMDLVYVGAVAGRVHGCLAFSRGSGRRACGTRERFAGLYVIDKRYRNSMMAGQLFHEAFMDIVFKTDVRTLRIRVNPTNSKALQVYLKVGFRAEPHCRPDEEGYIELISHLPGLVDDIRSVNRHLDVRDFAPKLDSRAMRGKREVKVNSGVTTFNGRFCVEYPIETKEFGFIACMDLETGKLLETKVKKNTTLLALPKVSDQCLKQAAAGNTNQRRLAYGVTATLDDDGTFRLKRAERLVLLERWPVIKGSCPPSVLRNGGAPFVSVTATEDSWVAKAASDGIERVFKFYGPREAPTGFTVETGVEDVGNGSALLLTPWCSMHACEHALLMDGTWVGGPALLGRWPGAWIDFESAYAGLNPSVESAAASAWSDGHVTFRMTWSGARPRFEGLTFPQLIGEHGASPVRYKVDLSRMDNFLPQRPVQSCSLIRPASFRSLRELELSYEDSMVSPLVSEDSWRVAEDTESSVLNSGPHQVKIARNAGIVEWRHSGTPILSGPFPGSIAQGSLSARRVGLWCVGISPQSEDRGVEWAEDSDGLPFCDSMCSPGTWTVNPVSASALKVTASLAEAEENLDLAVMIVPKTTRKTSVLARVGARVWLFDYVDEDWRGFVDAVAINLQDGRLLVVRPLIGDGGSPEIFLRQIDGALLITALSSGGSCATASWRLEVAGTQPAAVELLSQGNEG